MTDAFNPERTAELYDAIAPVYRAYYTDYDAALRKQGADLAAILHAQGVSTGARILDCSCGIGTQAVGLALQGYQVTGSDISPLSITEARRTAAHYNVAIDWSVQDMRALDAADATFDAVISCGNSLAHLLSEADMDATLAAIHRVLKPGGVFLAAMTDHEGPLRQEGVFYDSHVQKTATGHVINFQLWTWIVPGVTYVCDDYTITETDGAIDSRTVSSPFRIWRRADLYAKGQQAGFGEPDWFLPEQTGHHNPILKLKK